MDDASEHKALLLVLAIVTIAFVWLLLPFYGAVLWAVVLAIVFQPLHRRIERLLAPHRNLAAFLSVLVCIVIAIIPMILIIGSLVAEVAALVERVQQGQFDAPTVLADLQAALPTWAQPWFDRIGIGDLDELRARLAAIATSVGQFVAAKAVNVGQNTLHFFVSAGIMLYVVFFLFRDGPAIGRSVRISLPLSDDYSRRLLAMIAVVVRATVKGNFIIAAIQGMIGGVAFALLGIDAALLWGVLMGFLSLLPAVGAGLVWAPAAAYLILTGSILKGAILIGVGIGVIGLVDNLLRPSLVGKDTRLPDYVILVSTIGGLSLFGINGFVIGPLIAALFIACWAFYREEQQGRNRPGPR